VSSLIDSLKCKTAELKTLESEYDQQKRNLVIIKEERNKLIAEKHLLNNELEYIKSEMKVNKEDKNKVSDAPGNHYSDYDSQQDNQALLVSFDQIIEDLEEKISNLSVANVATKEQLDNISTELKKNEQLNKHLKGELSKQDKVIEDLIKEKAALMKSKAGNISYRENSAEEKKASKSSGKK